MSQLKSARLALTSILTVLISEQIQKVLIVVVILVTGTAHSVMSVMVKYKKKLSIKWTSTGRHSPRRRQASARLTDLTM